MYIRVFNNPAGLASPFFGPTSVQDALMAETFILIPGRTSRQGCGISEGKFKEDYQEETHTLQVSPQDMEAPGVGGWRPGQSA